MKEYIKQFYTEGFATTFYQKPIKFIEKKFKSKKIVKFFSSLIKIIYTLVFVAIGVIVLINKLNI
jgi:hypothetical protein